MTTDKIIFRKAGVLVLFSAFVIASSTQSLADKRLDIFLEKSEKFLERNKPLDHVDSPFRPYLQRPYEEGLNEMASARFRQARDKGDCLVVEKLLEVGFLGLYPFLKPAFDDSERGQKLRVNIVGSRQPGGRLCYNNYRLIRLYKRAPKKDFPPVDLGLRMVIGPSARLGDKSNPLATMIKLQLSLGDLAFCDDYAPAILFVLKDGNRAGGMVIAQEEELYLIERVLLKGGSSPKLLERLARLKDVLPSRRYHSARSAARERRLDALKIVSGFWVIACRVLQETRQRKATR